MIAHTASGLEIVELRGTPPAVVARQTAPRPAAWRRALTAAAAFLVALLVGLALVLAAAVAAAVGVLLAVGAFAARLAPKSTHAESRGPQGWTLETTAPRA
jgi:hypothetical protein